MAADGAWDGKVWQHGAVGWRMSLPGWRGAYMGDFLGMQDRQRIICCIRQKSGNRCAGYRTASHGREEQPGARYL